MCHKDTLWRSERASLRAIHWSHQEDRKLAEHQAGLECVCVCCPCTCYDHVRTSWNVVLSHVSPNWTINTAVMIMVLIMAMFPPLHFLTAKMIMIMMTTADVKTSTVMLFPEQSTNYLTFTQPLSKNLQSYCEINGGHLKQRRYSGTSWKKKTTAHEVATRNV